ncbi:MAG: TIGR00725 family protein [Halobaculum sp.]
MRVSVIGGSTVDERRRSLAERVGRELGDRGHTLVCGGLGGVMRAACRGARAADAQTVGILPTADPADANEFVTTPVATGMGHARNALVALNGAGVIAIDGGPGTLSEIGLARAHGKPVAGLEAVVDSDRVPEVNGVEPCETPVEAVEYVERNVA